MQKIVIVYYIPRDNPNTNISEINKLLEDGWKVINSSPMGAYGYGYGYAGGEVNVYGKYSDFGFASLVVLEK